MNRTLLSRITAFTATPGGRRLSAAARRVFVAGLLAYLLYQLYQIGWREVLTSFPTHPLFYLSFFVIYAALPVSEVFIYRAAWGYRIRDALPVFVQKRVYNKDLLGYSGEVLLYMWARKNLALPDREIFGTVKDNAIISSVASTLFAIATVGALLLTGQVAVGPSLGAGHPLYVALAVGAAAVATLLLLRFRRAIFRLNGRQVGLLFGIHLLRLLLTHVLQVFQWWIVLPGVPLRAWFTYLALLIVTSRIPFIPGRDFIFLGASLELSQTLMAPQAAVAALMTAQTVVDKLLNFVVFGLVTALAGRRLPPPDPSALEQAAEEAHG